jgi:hypothetical protein
MFFLRFCLLTDPTNNDGTGFGRPQKHKNPPDPNLQQWFTEIRGRVPQIV